MDNEVLGAIIQGIGTVFGALIVGIAGVRISNKYSRERDRQDKESQWRSHAIELTKLDLQRKIKARELNPRKKPLRPSILDFLANYRDLEELDTQSPADIYLKVKEKRITREDSIKSKSKMIKDNHDFSHAPFAHMFYFKLVDYDNELVDEFIKNCIEYLSGYEDQTHFSVGLRDLEITRSVSALNFEVSVNMVFKNREAYIAYSKAERHQEFITQVAGMSLDRIVYDSYIIYEANHLTKTELNA